MNELTADWFDERVLLWPGDQENEEESTLSPEFIRDTVVFNTDWTVETILNQIEKGNILLNPSFQRRDAWTRERKSKYIESLFLGLPVPQIVLAEAHDHRGRYIVLDGKQRLLALAQFRFHKQFGEPLKLTGMDSLKSYNGKTYKELKQDLQELSMIDSFENVGIRSVIVRNWRDSSLLHTIFVRLNTGSVQLSPQELRQALFPGPFTEYLDQRSSESEVIQKLLGLKRPDFRMRDIEVLLRLLSFALRIEEYKGSLKTFLDETCGQLNKNWIDFKDPVSKLITQVESAITCANEVFEGFPGRKWKDGNMEPRLNRAALDCQVFYFMDSKVRDLALDNKEKVRASWAELCEISPDFLDSIEGTTKSIGAVRTRLGYWASELSQDLHIVLPVPL